MRVAFSPLTNRVAPSSARLIGSACFATAVILLIASPNSRLALAPGDVVNYSEDQLGRPWRIVREFEFRRFVIRNGRVTAIAEVDELIPFEGYADEVTIEKAGQPWKQVVAEIAAKDH